MSWRWKQRIESSAKRMLLSDAQFEDLRARWAHRQQTLPQFGQECPVCKTFQMELLPFCGCTTHKICGDCSTHADQSDVKQCVFCPIPDASLHLECPQCHHRFQTTMDALQQTQCPCCTSQFVPTLLRIWKRGPNTYTNFLTEADSKQLVSEFQSTGGRVHCPTCRQPVERATACNELYHCGHERVCAACGQFSFRWEAGLVQHRRESGCACVPDENTNHPSYIRRQVGDSLRQAGVPIDEEGLMVLA